VVVVGEVAKTVGFTPVVVVVAGALLATVVVGRVTFAPTVAEVVGLRGGNVAETLLG
jgi:hypothetical protein